MYRDARNHVYVSCEVLTVFAWSAQMRDLASKTGLSDVGLRKLLKANGIVPPPQGYWNRVHAGRAVPAILPIQSNSSNGSLRQEQILCGCLTGIADRLKISRKQSR